MGSGISLSKKHIAEIIIRDLKKEFNEYQSKISLYTDDGYEIYSDFSDEVNLNNKIRHINWYTNKRYSKNKK